MDNDKIIIGTVTNMAGDERDITVAEFLTMLKKPDTAKTSLVITIVKSVLDYYDENPDAITDDVQRANIDMLRRIYGISEGGEPGEPEPAEMIPTGTAGRVHEYVMTKDLLTKAIFGEPGKNSEKLNLEREKPGLLSLWDTGRGKNKKSVAVYTRLKFDREALREAGITVGKNLSICAREVFGAMLSHYLAGNNLISLKMMGKIIFNTSSEGKLTESQKEYIINGAAEIFSTSVYINTELSPDEAKRAFIPISEVVTREETNKIKKANISRLEQLFPGRITTGKINGNTTESAIELFAVPTIYKLQEALDKGQILRVPLEVMEIGGRVDEELVIIRAYLVRRVDAMKHSKKVNNVILFGKILEELNIDSTDRKQRNQPARIRKRVERILDTWKKTNPPYIQDYVERDQKGSVLKKGAALHKIEVII